MVEDDHPEFPGTAPARAHRAVRAVPAQAQPECGPVQAIVRVRLAPYLLREAFERDLGAIPAVRSAVHVIGDVDYELRLRCRDLADLATALNGLRRSRGVEVASTCLVLGDVKGLGRAAPSVPGHRRAAPHRAAPDHRRVAPSIADWRRARRPRVTRSA